MRTTCFILFLLFCQTNLTAQILEAPNLLCIKGDSLVYIPPNNACGTFISFDVFGGQNRNGEYTLLGSITNETATMFEHLTNGDEIWYYYMQSSYECSDATVLNSDTLDNSQPATAPLIRVSVEGEFVQLDWQASSSPQTIGYIIYRLTDRGTMPIDTVFNNTSYIDILAMSNEFSEVYFVTAMDQCGNTSAFVEAHQTIFLESIISPCSQTITLNWNLYENWEGGIEAQEIWVSKNGAIYERVAVVMGDQTTYSFQNVEDGVQYDFFINAIQQNTGISAKSNVTSIDAKIVNPVGNLLVKNVTFTSNNEVELLWEWNPKADLTEIKIFRSSDNRSFENIGNPDTTKPLDNPANYLVPPIHGNAGKTFYKIRTTDQCDTSRLSNYVSTIYLEGTAQPTNENLLTWTPYDSRIGTVNGYSIYKLVANNDPLFLGRIGGTTTTFSDPLAAVLDAGACYYIEADISVTFASSGIETHISRSNTACLTQTATIVMPNAFAPNGQNRIFKPTILFSETVQSYQFVIYSRFGGKIFESTDINIGWNGQKNGKDIPTGTYTYLVRMEQTDGGQVEKAGVLVLLR